MRTLIQSTATAAALLAGLFATGCATATPSTIETRKQERPSVYEALPPEQRAAVDLAQIKAGMSMDAVYIAWGNPGRITRGGNEAGETVTWFYYGTRYHQVHHWGYGGYYSDFYPASYVRARVVFVDGVVKDWVAYSEPGY